MQVTVAAVPWAFLTVVGVITTLVSRSVGNFRRKLVPYRYGLGSSSYGTAGALMFAHSVQVVAFAIRSSTRSVDAIYHAIEILSCLFIMADILAGWAFSMSHGTVWMLKYAFGGPLILDCLVATAAPALSVSGPQGELTWFSFSFLGAARMLRVLWNSQIILDAVYSSGWRRQIGYHMFVFVLFTYVCGTVTMLFEHLGSPRESRPDDSWGFVQSLVFALSTFATVGISEQNPTTILGRVCAVGMIVWSLHNIHSKLGGILRDITFGNSVGRGSYIPTQRRFAVVTGSATSNMLWDFLLEAYHPNHFGSMEELDREAPDVVILSPDGKLLNRVGRFLSRREAEHFRHRITLLCGEAVEEDDLKRVALDKASIALVLPDLSTADVGKDDTTNVMRTFSMCNASPHVYTVCLLHRVDLMEAQPTDASCSFVSIDAFKLALLAKACIARGVLTLVCNLCRTVGDSPLTEGDSNDSEEMWQREYERGMGHELYEVPLLDTYDGLSFADIAEDVLARSESGQVYLIGIANDDPNAGKRKGPASRIVQLHPGGDFQVWVSKGTAGVFIAEDMGAIEQMPHGEVLRSLDERENVSLKKKGDDDPIAKNSSTRPGSRGRPGSRNSDNSNNDVRVLSPNALSANSHPSIPSFKEPPSWAKKTYEESMTKVRQRLLVHGLAVSTVADATGAGKKASDHDMQSGIPNTIPAMQIDAPTLRPLDEPPGRGTQNEQEETLGKLERMQYLYDRVARDILNPPEPPQSLLATGGHVLLCVVSDTGSALNTDTDGTETVVSLGPSLGIEHFMRPLRDSRLRGLLQPPVVVLASVLPADWHRAIDLKNVYFVKGNPMQVADLERAGFKRALGIAISRGHIGDSNTSASRVVDTRAILTTVMVETHLPHSSQAMVITDLAYGASCNFLPLTRDLSGAKPIGKDAGAEARGAESSVHDVASAFRLLSGSGWEDPDLGRRPPEEDFEELSGAQCTYHPRFMSGMVFVSAAMTQLLANALHNPSLVPLTQGLLRAPCSLLPVPDAWDRHAFAELYQWLLRERNILALGLYRSSLAHHSEGKSTLGVLATRYFAAAPRAFDTLVFRSDRVLCVIPSNED